MTGVWDTSQIVMLLAGTFGAGAGAVWVFFRANNATFGRLRDEINAGLKDVWQHFSVCGDKWERKSELFDQRLVRHADDVSALTARVLVLETTVEHLKFRNGGRAAAPGGGHGQ